MKLATIALFVAVLIGLALGTSSLLQYDDQGIGALLNAVVSQSPPEPPQARQPQQQPAIVDDPAKVVPVPTGTFTGPTGQPTIKGPTGPPPRE